MDYFLKSSCNNNYRKEEHLHFEEFSVKDEQKSPEENFNAHLEELNTRIIMLRDGAAKAKVQAKIKSGQSAEALPYKQDEVP